IDMAGERADMTAAHLGRSAVEIIVGWIETNRLAHHVFDAHAFRAQVGHQAAVLLDGAHRARGKLHAHAAAEFRDENLASLDVRLPVAAGLLLRERAVVAEYPLLTGDGAGLAHQVLLFRPGMGVLLALLAIKHDSAKVGIVLLPLHPSLVVAAVFLGPVDVVAFGAAKLDDDAIALLLRHVAAPSSVAIE